MRTRVGIPSYAPEHDGRRDDREPVRPGARLSITGTETNAAVVGLRELSTSPVLLGRAAGGYMAEHRRDAALHPFARRAADLLLAAGGDLAEAEAEAAWVAERLTARPPH